MAQSVASQPSAHAQVGLLLTQVRTEFTHASVDDPEGAAKAFTALRRAFELLNWNRCTQHNSPDSTCRGCSRDVRGDRWRSSQRSRDDGNEEDDVSDESDDRGRARRRAAFLESSYLPFASFLLRDVGPAWLPIWDSKNTSLPLATPAENTGNSTKSRNSSVSDNVERGGSSNRGNSGHSNGHELVPYAQVAVDDRDSREVAGSIATTNGTPAAVEADLQDDTASTVVRAASARQVFESFFRPPLVPLSLAMLALCESLGKESPAGSISRRLPWTTSSSSPSSGAAISPSFQYSEGAETLRPPDARTVQHVCHLLEPYLVEPSVPAPALQLTLGGSSGGRNGSVSSVGRPTSATSTLGTDSEIHTTASATASNQPGWRSTSRPFPRASLLARVVMELADRDGRSRGGGGGYDDDSSAGESEGGEESGNDRDAGALSGGDAAQTLVSALCLTPQRVANSLGPIAPPAFAPDAFFAAVCGAVVSATLACLEHPAPSLGKGEEVAKTSPVDEGGADGRAKDRHADAAAEPVTTERVQESDASQGGGSGGSGGLGGQTKAAMRYRALDVDVTLLGDVWRAFSGRLLTAGRGLDLARAWLRTMAAAEGPKGQRNTGAWGWVVPTPSASDGAAKALRADPEVNVKSTDDQRASDSGNGRSGIDWPTCSDTVVEAAWNAWTDNANAFEAHSWMMTKLPAARRRSFTEALLRALWPRNPGVVPGRNKPRQGRQHGDGQSCWPPGFPEAACRALIGRPLTGNVSPPILGRGHDRESVDPQGEVPIDGSDHRRPRRRQDGEQQENAAFFYHNRQESTHTSASPEPLSPPLMSSSAISLPQEDEEADVSVALVEGLLLQRPLPIPAAAAMADTLAWCDRRRCAAAVLAKASRGRPEDETVTGVSEVGIRGDMGGLLMGAVKRVAAVWAEPSFLNRSSPRQQAFLTKFLLAALSRMRKKSKADGGEGGLNEPKRTGSARGVGRLVPVHDAEEELDPEALALLIRGVGSHLDVPTRETRLRGMRVGEAVSALAGQDLRFAELDEEREAAAAALAARDEGEQGSDATGVGRVGAGDGNAVTKRGREVDKRRKSARSRNGKEGGGKTAGGALVAGGEKITSGPPRAATGEDEGDDELDPDMFLPLGGDGSDSETEWDGGKSAMGLRSAGQAKERSDDGSNFSGTSSETDERSQDDDDDDDDDDDFLYGDESDADEDGLEAYDLWDEQDDLAKVAEPVYLDQLIELLRSRDQPDTPDKHEIALKCAEQLIRRLPPDLPHRAPELSRDLLYLDNSFEMEDFATLRAKALVAATASAPETCAMYLGSELWGTGASEGTKLEILDILVQAASELAGWKKPESENGSGANDNAVVAGQAGGYPSALMQEPRGGVQGSSRRQGGPETLPSSSKSAGRSSSSNEVLSSTGQTVGKSIEPRRSSEEPRTRRWGYRRGPREELRQNLFGRFAPVFFYPLAQGMVLRLRESAEAAAAAAEQARSARQGSTNTSSFLIEDVVESAAYPSVLHDSLPPPPPPSPLFSARLLHALTCLVELCGNCPATPSLAADLLGLAWLMRGPASQSRELRRAVLIALATGIERSHEGVASGAFQGQVGELLRWLQSCASGSDSGTRELAGAVLGHNSVQALACL